MISALTGFVAGLIHVLSGPDHLAAVAPLAVDGRRRAWLTGFRWGLGHASGVILVGVLSLLLRDILPVDSIASWSERLVGVVLIGIGLWGFRQAFTRHLHTHAHTHGGHPHVHVHVHGLATAHPSTAPAPAPHVHTHAAFAVGTLHGLAGSSHFLGVLPALAFPSTSEAVTYLGAYGVGTVLAMASFSTAMGWVAARFSGGRTRAYRTLMGGCSLAAVLLGGFWLVT